jgi:Zn-finger nucleic acid-binding protein
MWFDKGELESWTRDHRHKRLPRNAAELERPADPLPCPRCAIPSLRARSLGAFQLSRCERCAGVWLPGKTVALLDPQHGDAGSSLTTSVLDAVLGFLTAFPW